MESVLKFFLGVFLIIIAIIWFRYERKQFLKERENKRYISASFTLEFLIGALALCGIGIRLIYDSFQ
ncbi:hypothetical protein DN53_18090 [Flagellimonas olearia]|uniref:Molybdenum ABC transporter permease n=1 Tax=Flagellimonas olearia TaxID=552546 RepID=A0A444VIF7_9FLAO|nr:hypothetical protein DN53_18090 [Allomuricauda olearia]|tara:strand:- start:209 stop:409 length:201 start_codon:yes stop_codon:yes gene_type:complete